MGKNIVEGNRKVGLLIPTYNEAENIVPIIRLAKNYCSEIILIIDGSTDNTFDLVKNLNIHIILNENNLGLTESIKKGFYFALNNNFDAIIKLDGDGQMDLDYIPKLIEEYNKLNLDIVCATYNPDSPLMIKKDIWVYSKLFSFISNSEHLDLISEYRLFSRKAMEIYLNSKIKSFSSNFSIISQSKSNCSIKYLKGGVNYPYFHSRPFPLDGLINLRVYFIKELWFFNKKIKTKVITIFSAIILVILLIINLTFGFRHNTFLIKKKIR